MSGSIGDDQTLMVDEESKCKLEPRARIPFVITPPPLELREEEKILMGDGEGGLGRELRLGFPMMGFLEVLSTCVIGGRGGSKDRTSHWCLSDSIPGVTSEEKVGPL